MKFAQDIINESNEPIGEQEQADLNLSKVLKEWLKWIKNRLLKF